MKCSCRQNDELGNEVIGPIGTDMLAETLLVPAH